MFIGVFLRFDFNFSWLCGNANNINLDDANIKKQLICLVFLSDWFKLIEPKKFNEPEFSISSFAQLAGIVDNRVMGHEIPAVCSTKKLSLSSLNTNLHFFLSFGCNCKWKVIRTYWTWTLICFWCAPFFLHFLGINLKWKKNSKRHKLSSGNEIL